MSGHALQREASPAPRQPASPTPAARPRPRPRAYLTEGDPRPEPPEDRARGSSSRRGGYASMAAAENGAAPSEGR